MGRTPLKGMKTQSRRLLISSPVSIRLRACMILTSLSGKYSVNPNASLNVRPISRLNVISGFASQYFFNRSNIISCKVVLLPQV